MSLPPLLLVSLPVSFPAESFYRPDTRCDGGEGGLRVRQDPHLLVLRRDKFFLVLCTLCKCHSTQAMCGAREQEYSKISFEQRMQRGRGGGGRGFWAISKTKPLSRTDCNDAHGNHHYIPAPADCVGCLCGPGPTPLTCRTPAFTPHLTTPHTAHDNGQLQGGFLAAEVTSLSVAGYHLSRPPPSFLPHEPQAKIIGGMRTQAKESC